MSEKSDKPKKSDRKKKSSNKHWLIKIALLVGATAIIMLLMPRPGHQSYTYELNQPWKYALLTAEFDTPIMRDSASANALRDSINRTFVPFVTVDAKTAHDNMARFRTMAAQHGNATQVALLGNLLNKAYANGIIDAKVYEFVRTQPESQLRTALEEDGGSTIKTIDAAAMCSPEKAFHDIDSLYLVALGSTEPMPAELSKAVEICLQPNYVIDSITDKKFRDQEYLAVNAAMGVIKKGQRIVDRGEIINPQIYTNLNTYLEMLTRTRNDQNHHTFYIIGQIAYILVVFGMLYVFLAIYRPRFFGNLRKMTFLISYICLFVVFAIEMFEYVPNGLSLVPFAAVPVVILVFFDSRTAIFSLGATILLASLVATFPYNFIFLQFMAGLAATYSINQLSRRSQLLRTALLTFLAYVVGYIIMCLITDGNLDSFAWRIIGIYAINAVILSFAYVLILVIEKIFGFTSTVTLVELSDINSPLLRKLNEEAPGTFQHSVQVSTLAAEAARAIGANTTLVRTGALYHDIGKLEGPAFYTENQHGDINPHAGLDPDVSARKIIAHVPNGLALAAKYKLPSVIRDFIAEHHGKGVTRYFYNTAVNKSTDGKVNKADFQYPGPNPQSRETAILMMADAVEAASRSLKDYSKESTDALVDRIIDLQLADGLFKESPISLKDIETVKKTFKKRLTTIYHSRVSYPTLNKTLEKTAAISQSTH